MKILHVTTQHSTSGWLAEALGTDSAAELVLEESLGAAAGCARLREETFDAVVVTHQPESLDALEFIEGLRAGGMQEPVVVLGTSEEHEIASLCFEVGADAYCPIPTTATRTLLWTLARAIQRYALVRENQQLATAERQRLQREHQEVQLLLGEQRGLVEISDLAMQTRSSEFPEKLLTRYRGLLRTYLVMGSGRLGEEAGQVANLLRSHGISARQAFELHVRVLEESIRGLGKRSARHIISRANLLILEVLIHLSEGFPCPEAILTVRNSPGR